jgi:hypothetical protein
MATYGLAPARVLPDLGGAPALNHIFLTQRSNDSRIVSRGTTALDRSEAEGAVQDRRKGRILSVKCGRYDRGVGLRMPVACSHDPQLRFDLNPRQLTALADIGSFP